MELRTLLETLRERGIRLRASDGQLRVSAPAGTMTEELKAALARHKEALLDAFRESDTRPPLERTNGSQPAPLSPSQERIWLFQELDPDASTYNLSQVMRVDGPLDVDRLATSVKRLAERHEALRGLVARGPAGMEQHVVDVPEAILRVEDLTQLSEEDRRRAASYLARQEQLRPFDLSREIPFRALLLRLAEERYEWVGTFHHAWVDGSSLILAFRDLIALYGGMELPDLPITFRDYARWERASWQGERLEREIDFWRRYLDGAPKELELPTDRARPPHQTFTGGRIGAVLDPRWTAALQQVVRQEHASIFSALTTAFAVALHRMSGQRDFLLGTPVAGRTRSELENLVGMFVNQIPIRARVSRGATFKDLLAAARASVSSALTHAELPFAMLLDALDLPRDRSRTPLFQAMVNLLPPLKSTTSWAIAGLRLTTPPEEEVQAALDVQAKYDLTLYGQAIDDELRLSLVFNRDLYNEKRARELFDDVLRVLEAGAAKPHEPMDALLPQSADSGARLLIRGQPVGEDPLAEPIEESVPSRFREVVARHGTRSAIVDEAGELSYADLSREVDALAIDLSRQGDASTQPIGIYVGHERRLAVAVLGVLAAGHPYVPLDPRYPTERLAFMAEDAGIGTVVTTPELAPEARRLFPTAVVVLTREEHAPPSGPRPSASSGPQDLAYLLFTSGSTGKPKAVVQSHGNLVRQADRYASAVQLQPGDRVALTASVSFDAFLMDFFGALLCGASVVPIDLSELVLADLPALSTKLGITVLHMTPTVLRTVASASRNARFEGVRAVVLGGEAVRSRDIEYFDAAFPPGAVLFGLYGCAEHSFALGYELPRDSHRTTTEVPIGLPVGDVEVVLLGEDGVEDPVRGQLALRSSHGALGYWKRDELTAASFVPAVDRPGKVLYKTGDVARRRSDGSYVHIGRVDRQLKVRGQRVEPMEIESVLAEHGAVEEVAVHGPPGRDGTPMLTACVVTVENASVDDAELAAWCAKRLPSFMVPIAWVRVDALPRTPSGKIDRGALPMPAAAAGPEGSYVAPRSPEEEILVDVWAEVLGARPEQIGVFDDFFDLGGHSLTATQVVARIRDVLHAELPLKTFFDKPTIADLADAIRSRAGEAGSMPPLQKAPEGPAPLSFSQERMWFLQQLAPQDSAYNIATALVLDGPLDVDRLLNAVASIAARHEALRTRIMLDGGKPVQVVLPESDHTVVLEDLSTVPQHDRAPRALGRLRAVLGAPFDLARDPALRVVVLEFEETKHVLGFCVHHALFDLWSKRVFLRELAAAYNEATPQSQLPPLTLHYRDYAHWQRAWLTGPALEKEVSYWRRRLADIAALDLPTDFPRPAFQTFNGGSVVRPFPQELEEGVRRLARETGVTVFSPLLAAFNAVLYAHTRQVDLPVGVPIAHRTHKAVEGMVGTFVNTLVHRNDLSGDPTFRELVARVRETALEAFAHQDLPFEAVVRELNVVRDTSRSPLFQVLFNLANAPILVPEMVGLTARALPIDLGASQFELSLGVTLDQANAGVVLAYNRDLYAPETARRLLEHYFEILARAVDDPDRRLSDISAAPPSEVETLLGEWNRTERPAPSWGSLPAAVEASAKRAPDDTAVTSPTGSWTYGELMDAAGRITAALEAISVGPGARVVILMDRSREMLAALIGVLGAGAAYVPVDPNYPEARVRHVFESSHAAAMITHRGLHQRFGIDVAVIDLDRWTPPAPRPFRSVAPDDAAYVIYTSGSTGTPKGVEVPHRALSNFLHSMSAEPGLSDEDVLLAVTTISFDIAALELYLPLVVGARVVIASEEDAQDGLTLARLLKQENATVMQATPATWKLLIAADWSGKPDLRVLCGGEALSRDLADDLLARAAEVWNMYGPTETTVWSTVHRIREGDPISIGRPIANTTLHVLDEQLRPLPIGVPGELWIGGAGVAHGYVGRPDLTAERFVPSPFRGAERLYRTGDLVRFRADGTLEHLGRLDHQVKVRGFRIELGEVETALRTHPGIRDAVVVAKDDRLVAYVIHTLDAPTVSELRAWVGRTLPVYMVPSVFHAMEAFPLTPNGKVDRKRLPALGPSVIDVKQFVPPESETERTIAQVWSDLLSVERVGLADNFFELGGHSLLAMQAVSLVEQRLGHRLEPRALFFKTLGQLAGSLPSGIRSIA